MNESFQLHQFKTKRLVKAFLLAPLIVLPAPLILLCLSMAHTIQGWVILLIYSLFALLVAYAHILILALPIFLLLKKRGKHITRERCLLSGFLIGALPYLIAATIAEAFGQKVIDENGGSNIASFVGVVLTLGIIGFAIGYVFYRIGIKPR